MTDTQFFSGILHLSGMVRVDAVPGGREPIVSAVVRVLDWLELMGEKDEYGEYNLDVVFRLVGR